MTDSMPDRNSDMVLNAAIDGELDSAAMRELESALADDPVLKTRYDQLVALRGALRAHAARQAMPEGLRARVMTSAARNPVARPVRAGTRMPALAIAAGLAIAFIFGSFASDMLGYFTRRPPDRLAMLLVDDHRRALLAREPIDVASSDSHTVKPWFDGRLALSPPVIDLAKDGFTLVGGRADVIDGVPVPTIVYRLREHVISVTALPLARFRASAGRVDVNGYRARAWSDSVFNYWAIGDLPQVELDTFISAFRASAESGAPSH